MMELSVFFAEIGGEYDEVLSRLMSESMIRKFLHRFLDDPSYAELKKALEAEDIPSAFRAAHTLKGIGGNLGLGDLTRAASALTEQLRHATMLPPSELVETVDRTYRTTVEKIAEIEF